MRKIPTTADAYRAPMRSPSVDDGSAAEWAISAGVVGLAGEVRLNAHDLDEVIAAVAEEHGEHTARRVRRFAETPRGSFVWARDAAGAYYLGRLAGDWRYDPSEIAHRLGLPHQRPCDWAEDPVPGALVPVAVIEAFARGGRNWQRIRAAGVAEATARTWSLLHHE